MEIYRNLRIYKVKMTMKYGTHHSKMIFIQYKSEGMRIVITSANMIAIDWMYKVNGIYLQDFPLKVRNSENSDNTASDDDFGSTLYSYCNQVKGMNDRVIMNFDFLRQYDFSSAKVLLVPSVPGYHRGQSMNAYGHRRLCHLLQQFNVTMDSRAHRLIVNVSSFGSLTERWLVDEFFRNSFGGNNLNANQLKIVWPRVEMFGKVWKDMRPAVVCVYRIRIVNHFCFHFSINGKV